MRDSLPRSRGGVRVELYSASLPKEYADSMRDDVGRAVELLSEIVGAPSPTRVVRVVYSPRPVWGYVRTPPIVVSEAKALAMREQRFGRERDWQYLTHEIAHYDTRSHRGDGRRFPGSRGQPLRAAGAPPRRGLPEVRRRSRGRVHAYVLSPRDAAFLGTWTGSLTQAGATNAVVLHLVARDGTLTASLDSPDQGVRDIRVPTVRLSEGSLTFALGNFGVSYRGVLNQDTRVIEGEWSQGGVVSSLSLKKVDRTD